jgi:hypothetical protein
MIPGLLTDSTCSGTNEARADVDGAQYAHDEHHDERAIARRIAWQTRDLDRLRRLDSDEVTTW